MYSSLSGTIFTSAALVSKKSSRSNRIKKKIQKLAIVFGRRLATTAHPREKKRCVCIPRGPDGGGIIECDNWGSGPLAILVSYYACPECNMCRVIFILICIVITHLLIFYYYFF